METARGTADHCQMTSRFRAASNGGGSTSYIVLFRLAGRQVQFSSGSPLSITDGDDVIVAGHPWRGMLNADAVHNVTTGLTRQSGIVSRIALALFLPVFGSLFALMARNFAGANGGWIVLGGFVLGSFYLLWRSVQITRAWLYVRSDKP